MPVDVLREVAPGPAEILDRLEATAAVALTGVLAEWTPRVVGAANGRAPDSDDWRLAAPTIDARALAFAEQFAFDVASVTAEQRAALADALGDAAFGFVQAAWVFDVVGRARAALAELLGAPAAPPSAAPYPDLWTGIDAFLMAVPGLQALDAVTTDLVRLRLATHHRCRLCQSLRSRSALVAGADDQTYATIAGTPDDPALAAAFAFVDAFARPGAQLADAVVMQVREQFSPAQTVELVLDTVRNAANKIAVAFGADAPHVDTGYEVYDVAVDGTITYGLTHPADDPPASAR